MPPQNMPFWYIACFELKALENQKMQEGYSTLLFLPESRRKNSQVKGALPIPGGSKHSYHQRGEVEAEENLYKKNVKLTLILLVTSQQLIVLAKPLVLSRFHNICPT